MLICVHWVHWDVSKKHDISGLFVFLILELSDKHYFWDLLFCFGFLFPVFTVTLHTWSLKAHIYLNKRKRRVCYSCSIVCYKRTIDCGMQFKVNICQQMPCIIWHCRNSDLFSFRKEEVTVSFSFSFSLLHDFLKTKCETRFIPLFICRSYRIML